jgi:hypothetical protein
VEDARRIQGERAMGQLIAFKGRSDFPIDFETEPRSSRFMTRIYRDIGLAVVAAALEIPTSDLDLVLDEAIKSGATHLIARLNFGGDVSKI